MVLVHPNESVAFLLRKFEGDFETRLRVRLRIGTCWYWSKPFSGRINKNQFCFTEASWFFTSGLFTEVPPGCK